MPEPSVSPPPQTASPVPCPKCGHANPATANFCIHCHQILIHRCPKCWHEQRGGIVCEKCGTNFGLYMEMELERSMDQEERVQRDKLLAEAGLLAQVALLPLAGLGGLLRSLVARLVSRRLR
jgi:Double zinc ribbon